MYRQITGCRICGSEWLEVLLELGTQFLTGVFPRSPDESLTKGPLTLVRCDECGLVQLLYSYERTELYGAHYGYRSSLNRTMVNHLEAKAQMLLRTVDLRPDDVIVDVGSNDGTLLSFFSGRNLCLLGFDPSAERWRGGYPDDSRLIADFFSADLYRSALGQRKARIVTSIAMFYDLERPLEFVREVADILADDGIWHLEQSYLPAMLRANAYDTICHEHVEYYAFAQIKWLADKVGLTILDVERNDVNGGSFAVTLGRAGRLAPERRTRVTRLLSEERRSGFDSLRPFKEFRDRVLTHKRELPERLEAIHARGESVLGYGASTKGNVILQFTGIDRALLPAIAEVNADKFGCVTPGTWIPIISETEARARKPDYFLVFPWHFRSGLIEREAAFLAAGGKLMFPLPSIEVVSTSRR
jgi:hypothetical protein